MRRDLLDSLRSRKINHKFHYDSVKQTRKWLALHETYSPSRIDPDCAAAYEQAGELNRAVDLFTEIYGNNVSYRGVNERLRSLQSRMAQ